MRDIWPLRGKVCFTSAQPAARLLPELRTAERLGLFVWAGPTPTMPELRAQVWRSEALGEGDRTERDKRAPLSDMYLLLPAPASSTGFK